MPTIELYHGSPKFVKNLKPHAHFLANNKPVVFASPLREIALASLQPWNDSVFEQGIVGEDPPYMIELQPNAFSDIYGGKGGYLYTLAPETFYHTKRLTRFELISDVSPKILNVEIIEDALDALKNSNMQMIFFQESEAFRMNHYRSNPYPNFVDCDEALTALLAEFVDDINFQKMRTLEMVDSLKKNPRNYTYSLDELQAIEKLVQNTHNLEQLESVLQAAGKGMLIKPIKFLTRNVEILRNVRFRHYTTEMGSISIEEEGFRGRATPSKQTLTRVIEDFSILDNGYIFAYEDSVRFGDTVVSSDHFIEGTATHAVAFDFEPDGYERQLIIPVTCILDFEYVPLDFLECEVCGSFFDDYSERDPDGLICSECAQNERN